MGKCALKTVTRPKTGLLMNEFVLCCYKTKQVP